MSKWRSCRKVEYLPPASRYSTTERQGRIVWRQLELRSERTVGNKDKLMGMFRAIGKGWRTVVNVTVFQAVERLFD